MDIRDAEDSILTARAQVMRWQAEFERVWYEPLAETMLQMAMLSVTPEQLAVLEAGRPELAAGVRVWRGEGGPVAEEEEQGQAEEWLAQLAGMTGEGGFEDGG